MLGPRPRRVSSTRSRKRARDGLSPARLGPTDRASRAGVLGGQGRLGSTVSGDETQAHVYGRPHCAGGADGGICEARSRRGRWCSTRQHRLATAPQRRAAVGSPWRTAGAPPHRNLADAPERPIGAREREAPRLMGGNGCLRPHTNRVVMAGPGRPPMTTGPTPAGMRQPAEARRRQARRPRRANAAAMGARLGKPPEAQSSSSSQSSPSSGPSPGPGPGAGAWLAV